MNLSTSITQRITLSIEGNDREHMDNGSDVKYCNVVVVKGANKIEFKIIKNARFVDASMRSQVFPL